MRTTVYRSVAAQLRAARKDKGWDVREAAQAFEAWPSQITSWETGVNVPSKRTYRGLCECYGVEPDMELWARSWKDRGKVVRKRAMASIERTTARYRGRAARSALTLVRSA